MKSTQGSVLGPLLFVVYVSPVAEVIAQHGAQFHQNANDTQLHLEIQADNTAARLAVLAVCTADVRLWYLQNDLHLNPDQSEALRTSNQLRVTTPLVTSMPVAGVDLPVSEEMKVLGVLLDRSTSTYLPWHERVTIMRR